jgi:arylsulfatase A-like enzyme
LPPEYLRNLPHEFITLPEALKEAGYKTFFAGKWHLGSKGSWPEDHGFDINRGGYESGGPRGGYFSPWKNPNLENRRDGENLSMRLAEETVRFLEEYGDSSFFAFLSFYAVHSPIQTTREKWSKYREKAEQNGMAERGFEMGHFLPIRQVQDNPVYGGLVESMDDAVGRVLDALEHLGLRDNTVVIFTSDNGGVAAGDAYSTSNLPLRAGKGYQFEGGIREPYFIWVPWLEGSRTCDVPVTGTDFYPTILDLTGLDLKPDEHLDGTSLLPLLRGENIEERPLIWHYPHYGNQGGEPSSIIRKGPWKLILYYEDGRLELYNLESDPGELSNIYEGNIELASRLHKELADFLGSAGALYPLKDPLYDEEKEKIHLEWIRTEFWPRIEQRRLELLAPDFDPGNKWWGSEVSTAD